MGRKISRRRGHRNGGDISRISIMKPAACSSAARRQVGLAEHRVEKPVGGPVTRARPRVGMQAPQPVEQSLALDLQALSGCLA